MRTIFLFGLLLLPVFFIACAADADGELSVAEVAILLDADLRSHKQAVEESLAENLRVKVSVQVYSRKDLAAARNAVSSYLASKAVPVVIVVGVKGVVPALVDGLDKDKRLVQVVLEDMGVSEAGRKKWGRDKLVLSRLVKACLEGAARGIGMTTCPNPFCVLRKHEKIAALDAKGRGLCPPCREKVGPALKKMGLKRLPAPQFKPDPKGQ